MSWKVLLGPFTDTYELKARGVPGLLTFLPLLVLFFCARGIEKAIPTALLGLLSTGGAMSLLATVARSKGKQLEERMILRWGGLPTTLVLRHRCGHYNAYTLEHIHKRLFNLTGIAMPTMAEEHANASGADARYAGATDQLRQATRGTKYPHLRRENIAYGFYRNALALKPLGLVACIVGFMGGAVLAGAATAQTPWLHLEQLLTPGIPGALAMAISLVLAVVWLFLTRAGLKRIGIAYAERLFECLDVLPNAKRTRKQNGPIRGP